MLTAQIFLASFATVGVFFTSFIISARLGTKAKKTKADVLEVCFLSATTVFTIWILLFSIQG